MSLRLIWREIRNNKKFSLFFMLNVALGLVGFITLDSFKNAVESSIAVRSKSLLTADLSVSSRRDLTDEEIKLLTETVGTPSPRLKVVDLYSMASAATSSRLVQIRAVEEGFPFYGTIELDRGGSIGEKKSAPLGDSLVAWAYPELLVQLGVKVGEQIRLGEATFTIIDTIKHDSAATSEMLSLAPRIYVGLRQLPRAKLLQAGSTSTYSYLFKLPASTDLEKLAGSLDKILSDPSIRVSTHLNASDQVGRLTKYLNDYLGLAALVAFFLAAVGAAYLFRSFLSRRVKDIAILLSLGLKPNQARNLFLIQIALLGFAAAIPAALLSLGLLPLLTRLLQSFIPFELEPRVRETSVLMAAAMGTLGNVLICLPLLSRIKVLRPAVLFGESQASSLGFSPKGLLLFLPAAVLYAALAVWQAKSWIVGGLFVAGLLGATLILVAVGTLALFIVERKLMPKGLILKIAVRNLVRSKLSTISCFLAIALGTGLINLIAQIQQSLESEMNQPAGSKLPSLFLFDIQDEQVESLGQFFEKRGIELASLSPMIRARVESLNGKPFEKDLARSEAATREEEVERRFRNRGVNLTYRAALTDAESIVDGSPLPAAGGAGISVEKDFAKRLGLSLGDRLTFDIQGVTVEGTVANFRKVRWTSFQPNFFIQFPGGVLEEAPKTFLASVPALTAEKKIELQNEMVRAFSNISMVDVSRVVERILGIVTQMSWALKFMAYLSLFTGFVVLFSIANHQAQLRRWDTTLLKVLGAGFSDIRAIVRWEFGLVGFAAGALGLGVSFALSFLFSFFVFDNVWTFSWQVPLFSLILITLSSVGTAALATSRVLRQPPLTLLQSG